MEKRKKRKIDFFLNNKHYRRLHLMLYFISISITVLTYFLTIILFSKFVNLILTSVVSFIIGLYIVLNRDRLVKQLSEKIQDKNRKKIKSNNKTGLKTTLREITPKNTKLKFNIKTKSSIKEKAQKIKSKINKTTKKQNNEYIEIE